jgi:hypothetical protein
MPLPTLNVDQKFQIRDLQLKIVSIQENLRSLQQKLQLEGQRLRSLIEGAATQSGCSLDSVSFDLETLTFSEKTPNPPAPPAA